MATARRASACFWRRRFSLDEVVDVGVRAEDAGFDSIWHVQIQREPFVPLTAIAARTKRIRPGQALPRGHPARARRSDEREPERDLGRPLRARSRHGAEGLERAVLRHDVRPTGRPYAGVRGDDTRRVDGAQRRVVRPHG